ncbi:uncharacterized protein LACBIDRAFT_309236 [Laccaria bicolor S238N-H82]|uniref:Predicted protein n=1 Tax=Laccaria bicolor (strain S238N-H82 / ATCC MYA-4686) TaxID=486041 RepID=B0CVW6_LACBS|nr:uncharacterized protein LACBIDRAFT_309236 [Laccaria bicolor S238N-H82]EDR13405.1 predicted protein [Laccaria bicolor S238N-H82]|eukprot:XP_001875903.1 predicted protein [Laccaria bicolor S238N-H82]
MMTPPSPFFYGSKSFRIQWRDSNHHPFPFVTDRLGLLILWDFRLPLAPSQPLVSPALSLGPTRSLQNFICN